MAKDTYHYFPKALRLLICSIIFIVIFNEAEGQKYDVYGLRTHTGFIIPHSSDLKDIAQSTPWGLQIEWSKVKVSENAWNSCNCYAQVGFSFNYFNYGNPEQLGNSYNLVYFAEPYLGFNSKLFGSFRAGIGATYLDTVYDSETNPENTFYSSPLSFLLLLSLNLNYTLSEKYTLSASAHYNHISNGGMKQPNKGMNFPTLGLGISYHPNKLPLEVQPQNLHKKGDLLYYLRLFGTLPEVEGNAIDINERKLLIGLSGGMLYHLTQTNAFNFGVEIIRNEAHKAEAEALNENYDHHQINLMVGHNFVFGRITFNQQIGIYLYRPFPSTQKEFFQRYELLYQLGERYQLGTSLKAHGHVADNFDLRLGILLGK
ncbi:MAG: acyloxyacyl hydrolase [Fulvivirga sp.]|nr:acyloxyacyl hydrolase [Fulvivirga sp.]